MMSYRARVLPLHAALLALVGALACGNPTPIDPGDGSLPPGADAGPDAASPEDGGPGREDGGRPGEDAGMMPVFVDGAPRILFTDVLTGPGEGGESDLGAYLSIFGFGFGMPAELGTTTRVYVGDAEVADYVLMETAHANPFETREIHRIVVRVGRLGGAPAGTPMPIRVEVGGTSSNTEHRFALQPGRILYVDNARGDDSSAVPGDVSAPYRHVQTSEGGGALADAQPGDFIVMRGGVWTDIGASNRFVRFRNVSGTRPTGAAGSGPITVTGYPGEDVLIQAQPGSRGGFHGVDGYAFPDDANWIVIANLRIEGGDSTVVDGPINLQHRSDEWRVVNTELFGWDAQTTDGGGLREARAGGITGDGRGIAILGNHIHGIGGGTKNHGIYVDGGTVGIEIAFNQIHDITGGNIIQTYDSVGISDGSTNIREVRVHHNRLYDGTRYGLNFSSGTRTADAWNNVIYDTDFAAVRFSTTPEVFRIVHNTIVEPNRANDRGPFQNDDGWSSSTRVLIANNVTVARASSNRYFTRSAGTDGLVARNNLWYGLSEGSPESSADMAPVGGSDDDAPGFVDLAARRVDLTPASPARDVAEDVSFPVSDDVEGRPRDDAPDVGAFERTE